MLPGAPYTKENTHVRVSHCHVASVLYTSSPPQNPDFLLLIYFPNYGKPVSSCPSAPILQNPRGFSFPPHPV